MDLEWRENDRANLLVWIDLADQRPRHGQHAHGTGKQYDRVQHHRNVR